MKTIILYGSRYGSTKAYAQELARRLGCQAVSLDQANPEDVKKYDCVVIGGGLYANKAVGSKAVARMAPLLKDKHVAVFTVGITPPTCYDALRVGWKQSYPQLVRQDVDFFHLTGVLDPQNLSWFHRTILRLLQKSLRKRAGKDLSQDEWIMLDALENPERELKLEWVEPIEKLVRSWEEK